MFSYIHVIVYIDLRLNMGSNEDGKYPTYILYKY